MSLSTHKRQKSPAAQRGFSLVELMIALLIGLLVMGGAIGVFLSNKQAYVSNNGLSDVQDSARVAFELMANDIRAAGLTGCGNTTKVANILKNGPNNSGTTWYANFSNAVYGYDDASTDPALTSYSPIAGQSSVQLIGADNPTASMAVDNESAASFTIQNVTTNPQAGDLLLICSPDHAAIAQVTSFTTSSLTVLHSAGGNSPGNCTGGLGYPTNCDGGTGNVSPSFPSNSFISPLLAADWYVGTNPQGGKSLYRLVVLNNGGASTPTAQEMVRNVTSMVLSYHVSGNTSFLTATAVTAANWANVDSVQMVLTMQSSDLYAGTNVAPITRTIVSTFTLRNRVN